ncbi:MAG: hypothetical protein ACJ8AO_04715 [Gemmatimonadaceae bacterium]
MLLLLSLVAFFGWEYGELYYRNYVYQDAMQQAVRFAERRDDAAVTRLLRAKADSLDLPPDAKKLTVHRAPPPRRFLEISAEYTDTVRGPIVRRAVRFRPHAEGSF